MKIGFNGASTMKTDLPGDIRAASLAGYDLIEIWAKKLESYLLDHSLDDLRKLLSEAHLKPLAINSVEFITFNAPWEKVNTMNLIARYARIADQLDCPFLVVVPSPRPEGATDRGVFDESVRMLLEISDRFKDFRVRFAFEFLGFGWCSVSTLEQDVAIVKAVNRANVGTVLDTFHFYAGGSSMGAIRDVDPEKIFILHVNDAEKRPKAELQDAHRLFPGEGVIPLAEIAANLKQIRYGGPVSLEMFRPAYWSRPAEEVARQGIDAIRKFLALFR
ncbi:MAG: sugar phosphate isomerase/epimerase [Deltaproteobacteria bacterium]|nr:sugar phosphate isomerase/epimerase [Deltaproteobacteria bacterium]